MPVDHRERAFEAAVEHSLLTQGGYTKADPAAFDRARALKKELEGLVIDRMEQNQEMAARFLNDPAVRALIESELGRRMYEGIRTPVPPPGTSDAQ